MSIGSEMSELTLATTEELLDELFRRETFVGVIIRSKTESRSRNQVHSKFDVRTSLDDEGTATLLSVIVETLDQERSV